MQMAPRPKIRKNANRDEYLERERFSWPSLFQKGFVLSLFAITISFHVVISRGYAFSNGNVKWKVTRVKNSVITRLNEFLSSS